MKFWWLIRVIAVGSAVKNKSTFTAYTLSILSTPFALFCPKLFPRNILVFSSASCLQPNWERHI